MNACLFIKSFIHLKKKKKKTNTNQCHSLLGALKDIFPIYFVRIILLHVCACRFSSLEESAACLDIAENDPSLAVAMAHRHIQLFVSHSSVVLVSETFLHEKQKCITTTCVDRCYVLCSIHTHRSAFEYSHQHFVVYAQFYLTILVAYRIRIK